MRSNYPSGVNRPVLLAVQLVVGLCTPGLVIARDSLGLYDGWAAFRDAGIPRCYAISAARPVGGSSGAYITVTDWPQQSRRNILHIRLPRTAKGASSAVLSFGEERFRLQIAGLDAWAANARDNATIVAGLRSATSLAIRVRDSNGSYVRRWTLSGAASAMDAATMGCAGLP
jgi:hypothetical protein